MKYRRNASLPRRLIGAKKKVLFHEVQKSVAANFVSKLFVARRFLRSDRYPGLKRTRSGGESRPKRVLEVSTTVREGGRKSVGTNVNEDRVDKKKKCYFLSRPPPFGRHVLFCFVRRSETHVWSGETRTGTGIGRGCR